MTEPRNPDEARDNEFIADLVRLLELHGNDDFKRKHAEIPMLLQQLDVLTKRRKKQEETLQRHKNRVIQLQELSRCHREVSELSKKLVKWLGNGLSTAELLCHGSENERIERIDRIRARAVKAGREAQVRDAVERLENLKQRLFSGLKDIGEDNVNIDDELEFFIQSQMKKEKESVDKTRDSINGLQFEVQKVDDELQCAESELQRAISSAYQNAVKHNGLESSSNTRHIQEMGGSIGDSDESRLHLGVLNHASALNGLEIIQSSLEEECYDLDDDITEEGESDDSTVSDGSEDREMELPARCSTPVLESLEQDNGKLRFELNLANIVAGGQGHSPNFMIETWLESHRKSTIVKGYQWRHSVTLPDEDAVLRVRVRAKNIVGWGEFSEWATLSVEGVRSRKRRLLAEKEKLDQVAREVEKSLVDELAHSVTQLKDALSDPATRCASEHRETTRKLVLECLSLHSERKLRPSNDASTTIRTAKAAIKESEKLEENQRRTTEVLGKLEALVRRTAFTDLTVELSKLKRDTAERRVQDAEVHGTTIFLEWQELINEVGDKGVPDDCANEFRDLFVAHFDQVLANCSTPPRALGDLLELVLLKPSLCGAVRRDVESMLTRFKKNRDAWMKMRDESSVSSRSASNATSPTSPISAATPPLSGARDGEKPKRGKLPVEQSSRGKNLGRQGDEGAADAKATRRGRDSHVDDSRKNGHTNVRVHGDSPRGESVGQKRSSRPTSHEKGKVPLRSLVIGQSYPGNVVGIARFGFFVDIGCEKPGLVHISAIRPGFIANVSDEVSIHDEVVVRVASVNLEKKTFSCILRDDVEVRMVETSISKERAPLPPGGTMEGFVNWPAIGDVARRSSPRDADTDVWHSENGRSLSAAGGSESDAEGTVTSLGSGDAALTEKFAGFRSMLGGSSVSNALSPSARHQPFGSPDVSLHGHPVTLRSEHVLPEDTAFSPYRGLSSSQPPVLTPLMDLGSPAHRENHRQSPSPTEPNFSMFGGQYSIFGGMPLPNPSTSRMPPPPTPAMVTSNSSGNLDSEMDELNSQIVNSLLL